MATMLYTPHSLRHALKAQPRNTSLSKRRESHERVTVTREIAIYLDFKVYHASQKRQR